MVCDTEPSASCEPWLDRRAAVAVELLAALFTRSIIAATPSAGSGKWEFAGCSGPVARHLLVQLCHALADYADVHPLDPAVDPAPAAEVQVCPPDGVSCDRDDGRVDLGNLAGLARPAHDPGAGGVVSADLISRGSKPIFFMVSLSTMATAGAAVAIAWALAALLGRSRAQTDWLDKVGVGLGALMIASTPIHLWLSLLYQR